MVGEGWFQYLDARLAEVSVTYPSQPSLSPEEAEWVAAGAASKSAHMPQWSDVFRPYTEGVTARLPWHAPVWDAGSGGSGFVPGLPRRHLPFWADVILREHPSRNVLIPYLRDGVSVHNLLVSPYAGPSADQPFRVDTLQEVERGNRIPPAFDDFVREKLRSLLDRGCIAQWSKVRGPTGSARPRMRMALSVEVNKPRLIYDARPLNKLIRAIPFSMDGVATVGQIVAEGGFMTSLDDSSAFHHICLHPASWTLFGFSYEGVDYCFRVLPFGFSASPWVYHTLGDAKAAFLRSREIPALAYLDDALLSNFVATQGASRRAQWLAACEATHVGMLVAYFCGTFLSLKKCDLRPTTNQKYLGMWCDSDKAVFRIPQERLDKMHLALQRALDAQRVSFETLRSVAGQAMSMSVAIRPAALYTQAMFTMVAALEKSGAHDVDLALSSSADVLGEFRHWLTITTTTHEGPWQRARHFRAELTFGASDASSLAWGGVVYAVGEFRAGGVFPPDWLPRHINRKEMYALYHLLLQLCEAHPEVLRRGQVRIDVDNQAVVGSFNRGRAKNRAAHDLLIQMFNLQIDYGFLLSLKWIPTAENAVADAISRPSRDTIIRLKREAFLTLDRLFGPFNIDLMACSASAQRSRQNTPLPFFSHYSCAGSAGVDVLAQDVSTLPTTGEQAFGFCFPPPLLVGHVLQHFQECRARAVIVVPSVKAYWFPLLQWATVRSAQVAAVDHGGVFHFPGNDGTMRPWRYHRWAMWAYEVDFRPRSAGGSAKRRR